MNDNILRVSFGGVRTIVANPLWQYDYGQTLLIKGLNLPDLYEVHFAPSKTGNAVTVIGTDEGVSIPDALLETAGEFFAWIYLHTGEADGETEYQIKIPVKERAKPTHEEPTPVQQTEIERLIALAEEIVEHGGGGGSGEDGFSPTVTITEITGGHRVTITDKNHPDGQSFNVMNGTDGDDGSDGVDGKDGKDGVDGVNGQDGSDGQDGADGRGITSITKTNTSGLVDTYTITYSDNTTSTFTVTNGQNGTNGTNGTNGITFTPSVSSSGVISWTNDGSAQNPQSVDLVSAVISALPTYDGTVVTNNG